VLRDSDELPTTLDIHDRIIVATALVYNASVVTRTSESSQAPPSRWWSGSWRESQWCTKYTIPGDGSGLEVVEAAARAGSDGLYVCGNTADAGLEALEKSIGDTPEATVVRKHPLTKLGLKGPINITGRHGLPPVNAGFAGPSPYANLRPARIFPGVRTRYDNVDTSSREARTSTRASSSTLHRGDAHEADYAINAHCGGRSRRTRRSSTKTTSRPQPPAASFARLCAGEQVPPRHRRTIRRIS